jgi:DNA polymerase elongation subunit (family B)
MNKNIENVVEFQAIDWYDYNTTDSKENMVSNNYKTDANNQEEVMVPSPDSDGDDDGDGDGDIYVNKYKFQIFGRDRQGKSVIVSVNDYTPFYFVQIPDKWGSTHLKLLVSGLKGKLPKELAETLMVDKCKIVKRKIFNGFTNGEEFKFVRLVFMNSSAIKYSRKIFSRDQVRFEGLQPHTYQVYESSLDPILQFMQIRDVKPCGWIRAVNCRPNPLHTCVADINVVTSFSNIVPFQENMIAQFVRESYDIECICQCDDEGFPNFRRRKDEIIQIGSTFRRYPDKNSYIKYIITQKKCAPVDDPLIKVIEAVDEKDLLLKYRDIVNYENPDVRYGYNSHGFDDVYIYERAKLLKIDKEFLKMGRNRFFGSWFQEKKLSSSGLGQNVLKFIESNGRVSLDIMKVIQREHNLPNYKLDFVAEHFLEQNKNDLDHLKLFANYIEGKPEQIREIAEYCVQDCELLHNLVDFLNILPNNMAMSNVSIVPLTYIFMRGQGIKIFSLVSDQCRKHGILIREIESEGTTEGFEGAYVYEPREAKIFYEPVGVMDFNSLYPSIMIAHNLSQDSIVLDQKYDNLPGIKYNTYQYRNPETGVVKSAKFVDHLANPEFTGILSTILQHLLDERAATREQIKVISNAIGKVKEGAPVETVIGILKSNERVPNTIRLDEVTELITNKQIDEVIALMKSKIMILDSFQLAFKVCANSIYGQCGSSFSKIRCKAISACVTAQGKNYLKLSEEHVREKYGAETIYGDSVPSDEPILIQTSNGQVDYKTIDELSDGNWYDNYHGNKYWSKPFEANLKVWTEKGWTKIVRVIKHTTQKKIYRVLTHTGCVDVTEDHSLLDPKAKKVTPKDIKVGTELLHANLPKVEMNTGISKEEAYVYGLFYADGSCGTYNCPSGIKSSWAINKGNLDYLNEAKRCLEVCEPNLQFVIMDTMESSHVYKLSPRGKNVRQLVTKYRNLFYDSQKYKIVPKCILNATKEIKESFMKGYYDGDGDKVGPSKRMCNKGKIGSAGLYYMVSQLGYNVSINTRTDHKDKIYRITFSNNKFRRNADSIKKLTLLRESTNEYVYDLETESHHFAAGVGRLIVHNTDSIFVKFNVDGVVDPSLPDEENQYRKREECRRLGVQAADEITKKIGIKPMKLGFEKVCHPLMLLRKKRYMYQKFEFDMRKAQFMAMGVLLKRRDNCAIVQTIYRDIVDILMTHGTMKDVVKYLLKQFMKFKEYNKQRSRLRKEKYAEHLKLFTTSKTLKSRESYKFPERIEHRVLADRMTKRDPGNPPKPNDRIQFVYVKVPIKYDANGKKMKMLQGDMIETPEYILEHNLEIDYKFYLTNKMKEPIMEILEMEYSKEKVKEIFNKLIERYDTA